MPAPLETDAAPGAASPREDKAPFSRREDTRRRITEAALDLFDQRGYAATTVDAIAEGAGLSRRSFFHHFASKDAVVFPDHEALIARVDTHLEGQADADPVLAVGGALRIVLTSYLTDPDVALRRYQLTRHTPELRGREIAWVQRYQLLFSRYLDVRYVDEPRGPLAADVVAAALVAVHNHVLRQWLKGGGTGDALAELDGALQWFGRTLGVVQRGEGPRRVVVAVFDEHTDPAELARKIRDARADPDA